jgi:hypothetical protein
MSLSKLYLIGGAVGLLLLTSKKSKAATSSSTKPTDKPSDKPEDKPTDKPADKPVDEEPKDEPEDNPPSDPNQGGDKPPPKEPEPKDPKLPPVDDDVDIDVPKSKDDVPTDPNANVKQFFDKYYRLWNQMNGEVPLDPDITKLWISKTCNSWGIGKNWEAVLPAKYVFTKTGMESKGLKPTDAISPVDYINLMKNSSSPDPVYPYSFPGDMIYYQWARNIIDLYSGCGVTIPKRENYPKFKYYENALLDFIKTPIGKLFQVISEEARTSMYEQWAKLYPAQADQEDLKGWALWAVRKYPKYSYVEQTDQAYAKAFENDPNAPKKLNPKSPSHQAYIKAWTNLSQYVKSFRNWIPVYG